MNQHKDNKLKNEKWWVASRISQLKLTRKIRIWPTTKQELVLWDLSEKCRLIYNFALAERRHNWEENREKPQGERTYITYVKQQNDLPAIKKQHPEYAWVYSKACK